MRSLCRYFLTHVPAISSIENCVGACHTAELPLVFHDASFLSGPADAALSDIVSGYWTSFARDHVPSGAVAWPVYNATSDQYLQIGDTISVISALKTPECDFWVVAQQ
jgi:carboxylesterase type B